MMSIFKLMFLFFTAVAAASDEIKYSSAGVDVPTTIQYNNNNIYFYGAVSSVSSFELKKKIEELDLQSQTIAMQFNVEPPPIHLHIQSFGGSLLHTFHLVDMIKTLKTPVYTYIDGFAASAATLISVAGKKRFISENSIMLVHQLSSSSSGKFNEMKDEYDNLVGLMDIIKKIYLSNSKIPKEQLDKLLAQDLWLDSTKAIQYGFVDKILK